MKIKTWEVYFLRPHDDIQTVKPPQNAPMHFGIDFTGPPKLPKLGKALAFEALDHIRKRKLNDDVCQLLAYKNKQSGLSRTKTIDQYCCVIGHLPRSVLITKSYIPHTTACVLPLFKLRYRAIAQSGKNFE
jgi:hypothetical protein